ncbi:GNAT family N-acetyltransferase [Bacillota bacterium Lsc_1132]
MIKRIQWDEPDQVRYLYDLQRQAYLIEANLIGSMNLPPLKESFDQFQNCGETFYGWFEGDELAGAISITLENEELTICRLAVHPNHFRKGIGQNLLRFVERHFADIGRMNVSTGRDNTPAINLYMQNGFHMVKEIEAEPRLFIRLFTKEGS